MAHEVIDMKCKGCGAALAIGDITCKYCQRPVAISTFNSVYNMPLPELKKYTRACDTELNKNPEDAELNSSVAMCYLKLKQYDKALDAFERAVEDNFDNSETFFYAAVCLLGGKKAFLAQRSVIDKAVEHINSAIMIEPRGIYYYFLAYIKYDYFERKYLNTTPNYRECLRMAASAGTSAYDMDMLFNILGVARPSF